MNKYLTEKMHADWIDWHGDMDADDIPQQNPSHQRGFEACYDILMPFLKLAGPHFLASIEAGHMLEGFSRKRHKIDDTADELEKILESL